MERWKKLERVPAPAIIPSYGPLTGMRVLMTGSIVEAPFAAGMLADYGAEVIHVERPGVGDPYRGQSPVITSGNGDEEFVLADSDIPDDEKVSCAWIQEARNKLSLTLELNMKIPEIKEIFFSLIKNCDVWMENMVWVEKLGLNDEMLFEVNPKLVIAHLSGFGRPQFGGVPEECDRPSYDPIGQAEGGWMYINGFPEPSPPGYGSSFINDYISAVFCANGVMMAYINAQKTGKGQVVDVAQIECMSKCLNDTFVNYFTLGRVKERAGNHVPVFQPANLYRTKDGYLYIGAFGPFVYERALKAMDIDVEKYPHEKAGASREALESELGRELDRLIDKWMRARTSEEGQAILKSKKVPCGIPRNAKDLANSEHYKCRGNWIEYEDQTLHKKVTAYGFVPKMSGTPPRVWRGSPRLGQDTDIILEKIAGYSKAEIDMLKGRGFVDPMLN
ncbi:CaiB/BaiF CoA transferase family protein [Desulfosarcina ovata]|uniref:CoA transferase n=1 Tax=Desulfosarcina ovata subsp. ovata TaxID=2752305 RepID=A0A5K8AFA1_9BACT|nr:CoA transferase [Desulfosarcina ovata]BBO91325.1 CoA transferase [Desulfosarcina ovata subsp. ovata]